MWHCVGYVISMSIVKQFAMQYRYKVDANQGITIIVCLTRVALFVYFCIHTRTIHLCGCSLSFVYPLASFPFAPVSIRLFSFYSPSFTRLFPFHSLLQFFPLNHSCPRVCFHSLLFVLPSYSSVLSSFTLCTPILYSVACVSQQSCLRWDFLT